MKFFIHTLGCKVNAYESIVMKESLIKSGFQESLENPDIVILNTCSVTNEADNKSLKMVRRLRRESPNAILVVCGCSVQNDKTKYANLGVDILLGNNYKSKIVFLIQEFMKNHQFYENICNPSDTFENMEIDHFNHVRAYIKIQDGCNNFCTYCIIPYLRGNLRCTNYDTVLDEAKILVKNGHQEITLTGIHTGTYSSNNHDLCDLINDLSKIEGLKRIRLSSIEITEIDNPKFYELLRNNSVLCDNMHIPIQAGSNAILKRMNRKYDLDYFKKVIAKIRTIRPDIYLSTDCMVGFPYETKELFLTTLETCRKLNFSKIHVFPYSVRKGTPAAKMPEQVSQGEKHCRARELIKLSDELERKYNNSFIGQTKSVLIEECHDGYSIGHTSNLLRLKIPKEYPINSIVDVKIEASYYE